MPKICYVDKHFSADTMAIINRANAIIADYSRDGFDLTLRQLYYQFVAKALIPNKDTEYKRLGSIINDARLTGLIDWNAITDRTRYVRRNSHWESPGDVIHTAADQYKIDKWADQTNRVEVWIEKDALVGVISSVCCDLDVPYFSCRGYTSASEMWVAAQRMLGYLDANQAPIIIHLGDHDPSGKDMTRDIRDRMDLFVGKDEVTINRIALNMDQIEEYDPPPNPAKITDSRAGRYMAEFGSESWELDALEPRMLSALVRQHVIALRDEEVWDSYASRESHDKESLNKAAEHWGSVEKFLAKKGRSK